MLNLKNKLFVIIFIILLFILMTGCSQQHPLPGEPEPESELNGREPPFDGARSYSGEGFNLFYPEEWVLLDAEEVQGSLNLRFQEDGNPAAQVIVSYFPAASCTQEEALQKAETLLRGSLFRIKDELQAGEKRIGDRKIPIIYTRSGEKDVKAVQTAAITGEKGFLLATLIAREEVKEYFVPIFRLILESMEVE